MSDTESFESVASRYDDRTWVGSFAIDRLKRAHDREIRDVSQREYHRGYEDAMHARATATRQLDQERMEIVRGLREFRCEDIEPWFEMQFWTLLRLLGVERYASTPADCDDVAHLCDRLIHLLGGDSNLSKSPNPINKGAEPPSYFIENADFNKLGERKSTISKLERLQFDGGSHENLSKIAYAIYPCATGWTCESAAGLRDKLIELIGGESDGRTGAVGVTEAVGRDDGRGNDCDGRDSGEQTEVSDERFADDNRVDADSGDSGRDFHFNGVMSDVLGNERHEAVCELRKLNSENFVCRQFMGDLLSAIDPNWINKASTYDDATLNEYMRDRLIHLLGGDQPSGIDVLREMDADGTCPDDDQTSSITDELRKYVASVWDNPFYVSPYPQKFIGIADRIDERARLGAIKADIWQDYANKMRAERDELQEHCRNQQKQLAEFNRVMNTWHWDAENHKQWCPMSLDREVRKATERWESACGRIGELKDERDELQKRLSELETFDPDTALAAFGDDNDELRKLLSRAAQLLAQAEQDRDTNYANWMYCKEKVLQRNITIGELSDECDRYKAACEAAQSPNRDMMGGQQDCIELPKDADGVPINLNDIVQYGSSGEPFEVKRIVLYADNTALVSDDGVEYGDMLASQLHHVETKSDSAESIVRELKLGSITEEQAIERIDALRGAE